VQEVRNQNGREDRDNGDHDHQLDERERSTSVANKHKFFIGHHRQQKEKLFGP
jgi:hypothetical protein